MFFLVWGLFYYFFLERVGMTDRNLLGPASPTSINTEYERSKDEYTLNGISVKDLLATKSTLSREEINWMISALENSKVSVAVGKYHHGL